MKKILILIAFLYSLNSFSQSTVLLRGDTIKVYKQGGDAVLKVEGHLMLKDYRQGNSNDSVLTWDATTKKVRMMDRAGFAGGSGTIGGSIAATQVAVGSGANTISGSANLVYASSQLLVNTLTPQSGSGLEVTASGYADQVYWQSIISNSQAYSTTPSAGYFSQVKYNSSGDLAGLGGIAWQKENAVDGEYGSRAFIFTRANGGSLTAALEINADQEMLFGGADVGDVKFQVFTKTASEYGLLIRLQAAATADAWQVQNSSFLPLGFLSASGLLYGTTGAYGTSTSPSSKAVLDLGSTTQGFLPPRMTATQRSAITSVPASLFVWDTDSLRYMGYTGSTWKGISWTGESGGGGGSGTVNTGAAKKAAYYPSAGTTVDDVTGVEYNNTNLLSKFSTQATTDVGLEIKLQSSQTANALNISSSLGTGDLAIIDAAGASRFTSMKIGTASNTYIELQPDGEALFTNDPTAALYDPLGFDNTHEIYGSSNARLTVTSGSSNSYRTSMNGGVGLNAYYGGLDGGFIGQETNQALNLITNDVTRLTISGSGAITVPEQSAPSTPAANTVAVYPKSDGLWYGKDDAGVETRLSNIGKSKGVFVASPTSADTVDVWQTPVAITITSLKAILRGTSPSVTYNIAFGTNIQSPTVVFTSDITCTSVTTGCSNSSGFNDATIPAGSFIWIYTTAASGTIRSIAFTINYTED